MDLMTKGWEVSHNVDQCGYRCGNTNQFYLGLNLISEGEGGWSECGSMWVQVRKHRSILLRIESD